MPYADPLKRKEYLRRYKLAHKEELAEREKKRYLRTYVPHPRPRVSNDHRRKRKAAAYRRYVVRHRNKVTAKQRRWRQSNAIRLNSEIRCRRRNDICFRLGLNLRSRVRMAVKRNQRAGSAVRDLGCNISEFKTHIESKFQIGMNWDNYGKWHLDHIIPLCKFDLSIRAQFLNAAHYTNYQPLWGADNCRKNKY